MLVSSQFRGLAILWAALQFALPGVLTILDGATALRDREAVVAHMEETSSKTCHPPHSTECGLCRYLSLGGIDDGGMGEPQWLFAEASVRADQRADIAVSVAGAATRARAPPLA